MCRNKKGYPFSILKWVPFFIPKIKISKKILRGVNYSEFKDYGEVAWKFKIVNKSLLVSFFEFDINNILQVWEKKLKPTNKKANDNSMSGAGIAMKADKLFISAIPAVETIAFYFSMGCEDTMEMIPEYVDTEQDRYLEYLLKM